jgi:hypothetical protein
MNQPLPEEKLSEIKSAIFSGRKIEAIKILRDSTGQDLAAAKQFVENLTTELRAREPEKFTGPGSRTGCLALVVLCILIVVSVMLLLP